MTASKTLTTAVAAATIVGAIGFAYAQTTDSSAPPAQGAPATEQSQNPTAGPSSTTTDQSTPPSTSTPSTSTPSSSTTMPSSSTPPSSDSSAAPSSSDSSSTPATEPAPKADRN